MTVAGFTLTCKESAISEYAQSLSSHAVERKLTSYVNYAISPKKGVHVRSWLVLSTTYDTT